jgi:hypothetical protein
MLTLPSLAKGEGGSGRGKTSARDRKLPDWIAPNLITFFDGTGASPESGGIFGCSNLRNCSVDHASLAVVELTLNHRVSNG